LNEKWLIGRKPELRPFRRWAVLPHLAHKSHTVTWHHPVSDRSETSNLWLSIIGNWQGCAWRIRKTPRTLTIFP